MKKFLILLFSLLFVCSYANASWDSTLDKINNVMNKVDRTEYTINRVKRRIPTPNTTSYPKTQTTTTPSNQNTNTNSYGGANQYQYQNTDYDNMPTQQQTAGQEPSIQQGQQYSQDRVFTGQASTLGELPAGTIVMDPKSVWKFRSGFNYSGKILFEHSVFWKKLEDNHYADGATLLLSEVRVAYYPYCHIQKGLRGWSESDVRRFLRTTFYTHLSDGFKNSIVNVDIPYVDLDSKAKTVNDNLFLLSIVEWGLASRDNNGKVINYDDLPNMYGSRFMDYNNPGYYYLSGYTNSDWTRTINRPVYENSGFGKNGAFIIHSLGTLATTGDHSNQSVRPAVNLKSSTKVSGPYEFKYGYRGEGKLIYYALEF